MDRKYASWGMLFVFIRCFVNNDDDTNLKVFFFTFCQLKLKLQLWFQSLWK